MLSFIQTLRNTLSCSWDQYTILLIYSPTKKPSVIFLTQSVQLTQLNFMSYTSIKDEINSTHVFLNLVLSCLCTTQRRKLNTRSMNESVSLALLLQSILNVFQNFNCSTEFRLRRKKYQPNYHTWLNRCYRFWSIRFVYIRSWQPDKRCGWLVMFSLRVYTSGPVKWRDVQSNISFLK